MKMLNIKDYWINLDEVRYFYYTEETKEIHIIWKSGYEGIIITGITLDYYENICNRTGRTH